MSGQSEANFLIQARQLRDRRVVERVEKLFSVKVTTSPAVAAAGSQQKQEERDWVNVRTSNGSSDSAEKAKRYIASWCVPETVRECQTDWQSVEQLLSETSKLRDNLETEFQTVILPGSAPSCVRVQGTESAVQKTIDKIHVAMVPPQHDAVPQPRPSQIPGPPSPQSRLTPLSTVGTFSPSSSSLPLPSSDLSSTRDDTEQQRTSPHQFPNIPTPSGPPRMSPEPRLGSAPDKEEILQKIAFDIEKDCSVMSRAPSVDSSHREQTIQYFLSLNFPREKIVAVISSMGDCAETDDILKRLNTLHVISSSSRHASGLSASRTYTSNGEPVLNSNATLRPVVIDGSNVAMRHGNGRVFSCRGIQLAVDWFVQRGHREITVFVPQWRRESPRGEYPITDQEILDQLEREKLLVFTPSRRIGNKRIVCYDDRFIVRLASETNGVIVSNDNFRDLAKENENWRKTIEHRLVMFTFVNDIFMVPEDPLGKYGPGLMQLLQMEPTKSSSKGGATSNQGGPQVCPYGERCTFGRRCRFYHPEREGRGDSSILTSRSPNTSPSPSERRHAGGTDLQSDSSHTDRLSPFSGGGPTGQPMMHTSPRRPRTSPTFPAQTDMNYNQSSKAPAPQPHGYSQPQSLYPQPQPQNLTHVPGYSQPPSLEGYHAPHSGSIHDAGVQGSSQVPQYLGLPPTGTGSSLSTPAPLNPPTPMGQGGVAAYPSRTFPIANIPTSGRPRNMTDRIQPSVSPVPNGPVSTSCSEDFQPVAPNPLPIVPPPHHHGLDPPPGLLPRGDYTSSLYTPGQYHTAANPHDMYPATSYNWPPNNYQQHYHHMQHHYIPSDPPPHRYHSPTNQSHHGEHVPLPTNAYHNYPPTSDSHTYSENSSYQHDQRRNPLLHHQMAPQGGGGHVVTDVPPEYRISHPPHRADPRYTVSSGPRASSMYGDMGMRQQHLDRVAMDKFQSSQSSPELYHDTTRRSQHPPPPHPGSGSNTNWKLFKQAQARLPDQEEQIMSAMKQYPDADLERLVELVQHPW